MLQTKRAAFRAARLFHAKRLGLNRSWSRLSAPKRCIPPAVMSTRRPLEPRCGRHGLKSEDCLSAILDHKPATTGRPPRSFSSAVSLLFFRSYFNDSRRTKTCRRKHAAFYYYHNGGRQSIFQTSRPLNDKLTSASPCAKTYKEGKRPMLGKASHRDQQAMRAC